MRKNATQSNLLKAHTPKAIFKKKTILVCVAMLFGSNMAQANPEGGQFVQGLGDITHAGNLTTIQQTSDRAIINWQSFGSNAGETIKFIQPSADAAILNRVVGNLPSNLNGLLEGTGRVYLINPNGIVVGANGVVNVNGGFVASTKSVSDSAFMNGGALVFTGESAGNIQILGKVQSSQGDIILIAPKTEITQSAVLEAGQSIKLVAANEVELSNGKITVKPKATDAGQITVEGALKAAQVQLEAHNNNLGALAINTTGTIRANGTQPNPDGSVTIMAYGEGSNIKVSGNISAQNNDATKSGGRIIVGRDETTGALANSADVSGASFETNEGFVETSGETLQATDVVVKSAQWLLDPYDIEITDAALSAGYTSKVSATALGTALNNGTVVTISTATGATNVNANPLTNGGNGNILVSGAVTAAGAGTLNLVADRNIDVKNSISATGANALNVKLSAGNTTSTGTITLSSTGKVLANSGDVVLQTQGGKIMDSSASVVFGRNITMDNTGGTIATDGALARGQKVGTSQGVYLWGSVTATGNLNIVGVTNGAGAVGVQIQGASAIVKGGTVNIYGESSQERGVLMFGGSQLQATNGNLSIVANSAQTVAFNGGGLTATNGNITISADSLSLTANLNASAGTVTLQNKTAGLAVDLGGSDVLTGTKVLGISNAELSKINAKKTVIGSATAGDLKISQAISTAAVNGDIALLTGGNININQALTVDATKKLTLNASGNGSQTTQTLAGGITASNLELLGANNAVDLTTNSATNKIGTLAGNVKSLKLSNQRDLTIGQVNTTVGLTTSGDINLSSTTLTGTALSIAQKIESTAGNVSLTAFTSDTSSVVVPNAAVKSWATVKGVDVALLAKAQGTTGKALGYYGAGPNGKFIASGTLNLTAASANNANGFYMFAGELQGNQININGTSASGQGVGFDNNVTVNSTSSLAINGSASDGKQAISLHGVSLEANGDVSLVATGGDITAASNNPWGAQTLINKITQSNNASGNVTLTTTGNGDITVPIIVNNSSGNVIVAAGSNLAAGNGDGGQVLTVVGNTITNTAGKTYIYSGRIASTGTLSNLGIFDYLWLDGADKNIQMNTASDGSLSIANTTAKHQVMFREAGFGNGLQVATYSIAYDAVVLSPVSFGLAYAGGATAAGGEVEGSCDAWSQRANAGSISVMSVLKPSYMGLRNAKTDTMDAMTGTQALGTPANAVENPCVSAAQVERQAKL